MRSRLRGGYLTPILERRDEGGTAVPGLMRICFLCGAAPGFCMFGRRAGRDAKFCLPKAYIWDILELV